MKSTHEKLWGHYTTQAGILGIVGNEKLWATNIKFLNDESEFQHALDLIAEIISGTSIGSEHRDSSAFEDYHNRIENEFIGLGYAKASSIFTLSFSEETDLLSQWRGYCPDNNGFCVIFDLEKLLEEVKTEYRDAFLVKCIYDREEMESIIRKILGDYWRKFLSEKKNKERELIMRDLVDEIVLLASHYKHHSFSEEKEHRIVVKLNHDSLKFRTGRFSIVPYIELPASKDCVKSICVGPTLNKQLSMQALETYLESVHGNVLFSIDAVDVIHSKTPYRAW